MLGLVSGCTGGYSQRASDSLQISPNVYVAQVGDSIESVAYRYRLDAKHLHSLNPGLGAELRPGDHIVVRSPHASERKRSTEGATREIPARYRPPQSRRAQTRAPAPSQPRSNQQEVIVSAIPPNVKPLRQDRVVEEIVQDVPIVDNQAPRIGVPSPSTRQAPLPLVNGWQWPIRGEVVREYAPAEVNGQGIDIAGVPGQPVMASAAGTVIYAARDLSDSGNLVIVRHSDDVLTTYSHVKDLYVAEDDTVGAGDHLASLGWNSNRESVLHFEIRKDGKPMNPLGFLPSQ